MPPQSLQWEANGLDSPPIAIQFAGMGDRFLAFLCDTSVSILLAGAFLAVFYSQTSLDFDSLKQWSLGIILVLYMTAAEYLFHGSLGKRLLGMQVQADSSPPKYPTLFQLLLRESVGKFICGAVLGIGFLAGIGNPKHKTWADRMASTVVVRTTRISGVRKLVLAAVILASFVALDYGLREIPRNYKHTIDQQLVNTEKRIDDLHVRVIEAFVPEPNSSEEYQQKLKTMPSLLEEYDHLLGKEKESILILRRFLKPISYDKLRLDTYEQLIQLRREILQSVRTHVKLVLAFDPQKQKFEDVLQDRRHLLQNLKEKNDEINELSGRYLSNKVD